MNFRSNFFLLLCLWYSSGVLYAQQTKSVVSCPTSTSPTSDWQNDLQQFLQTYSGTGETFCFLPGEYKGQIWIYNINNVKIRAPQGGVTILLNKTTTKTLTSSCNNEPTCCKENNSDCADPSPTIALVNSNNITFENLTIASQVIYPEYINHQVSRALYISGSHDINLKSCRIQSAGKQAIAYYQSSISMDECQVKGNYFLLNDENSSNVYVSNSSFEINYERKPDDIHAAFWACNSNLNFVNCHFTYHTGQGFVAGINQATNKIEVNGGTVNNYNQMSCWLQIHPEYQNIKLFITGPFPISIKSYQSIIWENACLKSGAGMELHLRSNATELFATVLPVDYTDWIDHDDYTLTGSFLKSGQSELLFLNTGGGCRGIRVQDYNSSFHLFEDKEWITLPKNQPFFYTDGWFNPNDRILAGDFLGTGKAQILLFNVADKISGSIMFQEFNTNSHQFENKLWINGPQIFAGSYGGWLDIEDRIIAGDFLGTGKTQLLFFNTSDKVGGAIKIQEFNLNTNEFEDKEWINWSQITANSYGGWLDSNDQILAGDFLGTGKAQLLFFNSSDKTGGAIRIQEFNANSHQFENKEWIDWSRITVGSYGGWLDFNDRILVGDFLGTGKAQLLFFNSSDKSGGAIRIQEFNPNSHQFENKEWINWSQINLGSYR